MPPCQRKGRVTWTSEKDENIQRLLERKKIAGDNLFDMESRIRQSMYKRMEEGNADLNLTLKILQQRLGSLKQDVARSNVAFIHLRGGLSRQATTSNILLEDFVSIREAIDKLNSCSGASTIESKEWTTCIEEEIASLNNKLQQHETIRTRAREEDIRFCNGLRMHPGGAEDEPELPTRFRHDLENSARNFCKEMEGRLYQKMDRDIEKTVTNQVSSSMGNHYHHSGLTEEGMKVIFTSIVRKELGTIVRNEVNEIEGQVMRQVMKSISSLVHDTVSKELSAVFKDTNVEKHDRKGGFYTTRTAEEMLVVHENEDLENVIISSHQALSLRLQKMEADILSLNHKHTNYMDTGCFIAEAPELNGRLLELTKRVDALTNELRARHRSGGEYYEYHEQRKEAGGDTTEVAKNRIKLKEHEHNTTDMQDIISTQDTLSLRLEQMESMFISISQKYSLPVVENLGAEVPELNKRLTELTKRVDAVTVTNELRGDVSDIDMRIEEQCNRNPENIISSQNVQLLQLKQVGPTILSNDQKDNSPVVDFAAEVPELSSRLTDFARQVSNGTLTKKLEKGEERSPGNQEKEKYSLRYSEECTGRVLGPSAASPPFVEETIIEQQTHDMEATPNPTKPEDDRRQDVIDVVAPIPSKNKLTVMGKVNGRIGDTSFDSGVQNEMGVAKKIVYQADDDVRGVEATASPRVMQVLGLSTKCNEAQKRALDGMVINYNQEFQATTLNNDNEVGKFSEMMESELSKASALDRLRAWRADIAARRKEGKQQLDSDDLEEPPCLLLNGGC